MILEEENYLEHYGKKGMRWGSRKQKIEAARKYVTSGKSTADRINNTITYRQNKQNLGRVAAWQIAKVEQKRINSQIRTARKAKDGKEFALKLLTAPLSANVLTGLVRKKAILNIQSRR